MEVVILGIVNYLTAMSAANPKLVSVFAILYVVGLGFKVLRSAVEAFVLESPSKVDDAKLDSFKNSSAGKIVFFIADLLVRFKTPGK